MANRSAAQNETVIALGVPLVPKAAPEVAARRWTSMRRTWFGPPHCWPPWRNAETRPGVASE